jgi:hypothetical protein
MKIKHPTKGRKREKLVWKQNEVLNAKAHHELFPAMGKVPGLRHGMQLAQRLPAMIPRAQNVPCACSRNGLPYLHMRDIQYP